jgi:TonB family protein
MRKTNLIFANSLGIALALSVMSGSAFAGAQSPMLQPPKRPALSLQDERNWQRVWPKGEEISIETPLLPNVMINPDSYFSRSYEKVVEKRTYSAYAGDFIFIVESYKTKNPNRLLDDMLANVDWRDTFKTDAIIGGLSGKQYLKDRNFFGNVYYVAAKSHVYVITLATMSEGEPSATRFLSSIKFGDANAGAEMDANSMVDVGGAQATDTAQAPPLSSREVTRKAVIVWKPAPRYTEEARRSRSKGTVVIKAILASNGQVTNIRPLNELKDGLTESAIEAARSMRFFPAEKDGKPVSQSVQLEYNFDVY